MKKPKIIVKSLSQNRQIAAQGADFTSHTDLRNDRVHVEHCCAKHGCKYGEDDLCPVVYGRVRQVRLCDVCADVEVEKIVWPHLFTDGKFTSHAGLELFWKINCDALTDEDLQCLAAQAVEPLMNFKRVIGVGDREQSGGHRFATFLTPYCKPDGWDILLVDDVWTTGSSMRAAREKLIVSTTVRKVERKALEIHGLVIFARAPVDWWVTPMFTLGGLFQ